MPTKGQIIKNPVSGDTYEFVEPAKESKTGDTVLKATIKTKGALVPNHYHTHQDETFEVQSGELTIWLDGHIKTLKAGDKLVLSKNIPHNHYNDKEEPVTYIHTVSPGLDFDYQIETLMGLAADGKSKNGKYGLMQALVFLKYLDSKTYLADLPVGIQKALANTLAPIGKLLGYKAVYKKYSGIEK